MNSLEKKSFYSFLGLYLFSSLIFVFLSGYWYYSSQKNAIESETYYKLEHFADKLSGDIIYAHMQGKKLELPKSQEFEYSLIGQEKAQSYKSGYFQKDGYKVLISDAPREHLHISYVIVKTKYYTSEIEKLQKYVLTLMACTFCVMVLIAFYLSKLFMRPLHRRVEQIESFIQDVTHELNTPITALGMSASRGIKKEVYDKKILRNISISTKQLESIYKSLVYLNFDTKQELQECVDIKSIVENVVLYYEELTSAKEIQVTLKLSSFKLTIEPTKAELLISNLLSNAIKYSMPQSTISITLKDNLLSMNDEGVGIAKEKLKSIFELYNRDSNIAGGFGVGLSIVKQICDENSIKVEVESELEKGSRFSLLFPKLGKE